MEESAKTENPMKRVKEKCEKRSNEVGRYFVVDGTRERTRRFEGICV